jgi:hypothetical protein
VHKTGKELRDLTVAVSGRPAGTSLWLHAMPNLTELEDLGAPRGGALAKDGVGTFRRIGCELFQA